WNGALAVIAVLSARRAPAEHGPVAQQGEVVDVAGGDIDDRDSPDPTRQAGLAETVVAPGEDGSVLLQRDTVKASGGNRTDAVRPADAAEIVTEIAPGDDASGIPGIR